MRQTQDLALNLDSPFPTVAVRFVGIARGRGVRYVVDSLAVRAVNAKCVPERVGVRREVLTGVEVRARNDRIVPRVEAKRVILDDVSCVDILDCRSGQQPNRRSV